MKGLTILIRLSILYFLCTFSFSCATILKGANKTADIKIDSNVKGAKVYVDEMYVGNTPGNTTVLQKKPHHIRLEKNGYQPSFYTLTPRVQVGYVLVNFLVFPPVGHLVDLISGAWKTPKKKNLFIPMSLIEEEEKREQEFAENVIENVEEIIRYSNSDIDFNIPKVKFVNEHAIAVVIGNTSYEHADVPDVKYAINDAHTMKQYLMNSFGFKEGNIIYLENATQAQMNSVFGTKDNHKGLLYNYIRENKSDVFVFYSGHGAPDLDTKEGYFMPVDSNPNTIALNGYSLDTFYKNLSKVPYKNLTVLIDACFSGQSDGGALIREASPVIIKPRNIIFNDPNAIVLTASASTQIASWYSDKEHSLFTYFTLKGIQGEADQNKDKKITITELRNYVENEVSYMARRLHGRTQTPEVIGEEDKVFVNLRD